MMKPFVAVLNLLVRSGTLTVIDADGERHVFGDGDPAGGSAAMSLHDKRLHRLLVTSPSLALGEGFMDGTLVPEDGATLYQLLTLLMRNKSEAGTRGFIGLVDRITRTLDRWLLYN